MTYCGWNNCYELHYSKCSLNLDGDRLERIQRNSKSYERAKIYDKKISVLNNLIQQWLKGLGAILK